MTKKLKDTVFEGANLAVSRGLRNFAEEETTKTIASDSH